MGLFLQNSSIKHVAHHFTFSKHSSSAFEDHQILKILTSQWKPFVRLSILQGVLAECKQKKVTLFITVVICTVLNVACILAQWHEASLLCKGKKGTARIVPCGGVLLYQVFVTRFIALLAGSETVLNTLLAWCKGW